MPMIRWRWPGRLCSGSAGGCLELELPAADWTVIEPGLKQSHGRGQRLFRRVRTSPSKEHLHEWRKQVKILGYQLRLLCPRWPAATRQRQAQLETLGKVLGEDHDLLLLKQFAAEQGPARERKALKPLIETRQKQLRSAALKLGALIYREAPAEFCRQLGKELAADKVLQPPAEEGATPRCHRFRNKKSRRNLCGRGT